MKHLPLITLLIISLIGYSQNESYIEVKVSENVDLIIDKIIYKVSNEDINTNLNFFNQDQIHDNNISDFSENEFEKFLKKNKIECIKKLKHNYKIPGNAFNNYYFTLHSEEELLKLIETLSEIKWIHGSIEDVEYTFPEELKKELFNKLYLKAKTEAEYIAASGGSEIGKMIQIKEESSFMGDYEDFYKEIFKQTDSQFNIFGINTTLEKSYKRTLIFRFELK